MTTAGREAAASTNAAGRFRSAASDSGAALDNIDTAPRELVPGSMPTTAEVSGDVGLLGAQRYRETNSPEFGRDVMERRGEANTARMGFLEGQAPQTASIEDTQAALRGHLANIDAQGDQAATWFRGAASRALPEAAMTPDEGGATARGAIDAERAPQGAALAADEAGAQSTLSDATGAFGGQEALTGPEAAAAAPAAYGAAMRDPLAASYANEQQQLRTLRNSIDPTGTMGMQAGPIRNSVAQIAEMFPAESGNQFSAAERNLYRTIGDWGDIIPIERAFQLRANVNGRLRGLQGSDPQEGLRLNVLKGGIDDAISQAAREVDTAEQTGVVHQGLPPLSERVADVAPQIGSRVYTAAGRPMDVRYELADLAGPNAPIVSHDIEGTPNPAYPQDLQPRDRSRAANAVQVRRMAGQLQPERLGASVSAGEGAPIIGPDNIVEM